MEHDTRIPVSPELLELNNRNADGVCSWLVGNGELCTTLGPNGLHDHMAADLGLAAATQHFVLAGRRDQTPGRRLLKFGRVTAELTLNDTAQKPDQWRQCLSLDDMAIRSEVLYPCVRWSARTLVTLPLNVFLGDIEITPTRGSVNLLLALDYELPAFGARVRMDESPEGVDIRTDSPAGPITIRFLTKASGAAVFRVRCARDGRIRFLFRVNQLHSSLRVRLLIQFSDRKTFAFPGGLEEFDTLVEQHVSAWREVLLASNVTTGVETLDVFRHMALYTLRTQLTPWSIGPTLSERYWGGGAFHDEMYPFFALISGNLPELARRIPYFRRTTLPQAIQRARGVGALYPWSSTEEGEERDPDGLWLTERFHLAQFSTECWALWLYERQRDLLQDVYPVLREVARFYEREVVEALPDGRVRTGEFVDFDESVGAVRNGPFTVAGAQAALRWAALAAAVLDRDPDCRRRWYELARDLESAVHTDADPDSGQPVFGIPGGVPFHYSVLGHIFPFRTEVMTPRARRTAALVHRICRSSRGWKPGFSPVYDGSNWLWVAGHLGVVHAMLHNPGEAWAALRGGLESCRPALIPNEHLDGEGNVHVPWFTTGVGAWLYALHAAFVWVDEEATHLLSALPPHDLPFSFCNLRGSHGVNVSGSGQNGRIDTLTALAPRAVIWHYSVPRDVTGHHVPRGRFVKSWESRDLYSVVLPAGQPVTLIGK